MDLDKHLFELAADVDDPQAVVLAALRMLAHTRQCLERASYTPLPEAVEIAQLVQDWLADKDDEKMLLETTRVSDRAVRSAVRATEAVWSHYLAADRLVRMLTSQDTSTSQQAEQLSRLAAHACNACSAAICGDDKPTDPYLVAWQAERAWQIECLVATLSYSTGTDGARLRNSLLSGTPRLSD